jgi:hypothetical protein
MRSKINKRIKYFYMVYNCYIHILFIHYYNKYPTSIGYPKNGPCFRKSAFEEF